MEREAVLELRNVSKFFPGVVANDKVNLTINKGEVHTLLGENGAGKTTLMNILYGLYQADEGEIIYEGKQVHIKSPNDALENGIGMIHQHFMLIPNFTVWENVCLGEKMKKSAVLPVKELKKKVEEIGKALHMEVDPNQKVMDLSVGAQQKVEIMKAIYRGARFLILDEPTSVLTPQESEELFVTLRKLQKEGCTIIFISHKLNEVMEISDRISVLRDGHLIRTMNKADCTTDTLTAAMVGRDVSLKIDKAPADPGEVRLEVKDLVVKGETHASSLKGINFQVRAGEILGIAGVDGNGQGELANVIAGIALPESGKVFFNGKDVTNASIRERMDKTLSYNPADRRGEGLTLMFTLYENAGLTSYYKAPYSKKGLIDFKEARRRCNEYIKTFNVKAPGTDVTASTLSGGNQQKLVLAREMSKNPEILLIVQPTWGLDIGACEFVYQKMIEERDKGTAILLISTDLEEVRELSDRLLVLYEGEIQGEVDPKTAKVEEIGELMVGAGKKNK
jgi:simple sugar transport system ATP-binding protein